jgi:hypothetical protein
MLTDMPPLVTISQTTSGKASTIMILDQRFAQFLQVERRIGAPAVLVGEIGHRRHHQQRHENAGNDAGEKQRTDRDIGHHAVDDEGQGRRDDRPQRGRRGGDADGKLRGVAVVLHRLDLDGAEARSIGNRRARHAGEDHRADDVDLAKTALHPAHQRHRKAVDAAGDAGDVHQIAGEDEKRHGEQREALDPGDHALGQRHIRRDAGIENVDQRGDRHRQRHRQAKHHQKEKSTEKDQHQRTPSRQMRRGAQEWNSRAASSARRPEPSAATSARSRQTRSSRSSPSDTGSSSSALQPPDRM